jgi:hypothetical protein
MRDTSQPKSNLSSHHTSEASDHNHASTPGSSGRFDGYNNSEETSSEAGLYTSPIYPWGNLKARAGRGSIIKAGLASCPDREVDLGTSIISAAWASAALGMDGNIWPEEDEGMLGQAIIEAWRMVVIQQQQDGYMSHDLEEATARKVGTTK